MSCPQLAAQLLKQVSTTCSSKKLIELVGNGQARLLGANKPLKTGKRKGRRFFKNNVQRGKPGRQTRSKNPPKDNKALKECLDEKFFSFPSITSYLKIYALTRLVVFIEAEAHSLIHEVREKSGMEVQECQGGLQISTATEVGLDAC